MRWLTERLAMRRLAMSRLAMSRLPTSRLTEPDFGWSSNGRLSNQQAHLSKQLQLAPPSNAPPSNVLPNQMSVCVGLQMEIQEPVEQAAFFPFPKMILASVSFPQYLFPSALQSPDPWKGSFCIFTPFLECFYCLFLSFFKNLPLCAKPSISCG